MKTFLIIALWSLLYIFITSYENYYSNPESKTFLSALSSSTNAFTQHAQTNSPASQV